MAAGEAEQVVDAGGNRKDRGGLRAVGAELRRHRLEEGAEAIHNAENDEAREKRRHGHPPRMRRIQSSASAGDARVSVIEIGHQPRPLSQRNRFTLIPIADAEATP